MKKVRYPIALTATFLWIGFVSAISFMEAWLKFRAAGVTLPIGLGIGRLVFNALNKAEWAFALIILGNLLFAKSRLFTVQKVGFLIALALLIMQSVWALPGLDARAELHIQGQTVPPSYLHFYYVGMELVKVVCLSIFGLKLFSKT